MIIPFGKYKGSEVSDLPTGYIEWLLDNLTPPVDLQLKEALAAENHRRKNPSAGYTTKLPITEFMNQLGQLLMKAPDKFFEQTYDINSGNYKFIIKVVKMNG